MYSQKKTFSLKLMNWPNKLECYIILGWRALAGKKALASLVH
jgi:hypothetical protein